MDPLWEDLETETSAPAKVSFETLSRILQENENTIFGKENLFESITTQNFKDRLPLTTYKSYESYIDRIAAGEDNVLSAREVKYFMTTSGTTGKSKLIPGGIGNHDTMDRLTFLQEYYDSKENPGQATLLLVNKPPLQHDKTERHRMIGPFTAIIVQSTVDKALVDRSFWRSCTPPNIHLLENYEEFCYLAALYALRVRDLKVLRTTFLPNLLSFFHVVQYRWRELINDVRSGTITSSLLGLGEDVVESLRANFIPDPAIADDLEDIFNQGVHDGFISRLWPQLVLVACVTGGSFSMYVPQLKSCLGPDVTVYSPFMIGSEGFYGTNYSPGEHESLYHPSVKLNYFEFIEEKDVDNEKPSTLDLEDLKVGERYEMVITNNGLYRFRMGDVVVIKSFHNKMPLFDMCYRLGSVINMVGEKTSEGHLLSVLQSMDNEIALECTDNDETSSARMFGEGVEAMHAQNSLQLIDFTTSVDTYGAAPRYIVYIELKGTEDAGEADDSRDRMWSSERFDRLLRMSNDQYGLFREQGRLLPAEVRIVTAGLCSSLCDLAKANGTAEVQFKVPRLLTSDAQRKVIESKVRFVL